MIDMSAKMGYWSRLRLLSAGLLILWAGGGAMHAAQIDPGALKIYPLIVPQPPSGLLATNPIALPSGTNPVAPSSPNVLTKLTDNNPATLVTLTNSGTNAIGLFIDLGQTNVVDRVFLIGGNHRLNLWPDYSRTNPPLGLIVVSIGNNPGSMMKRVGEWTVPYDAGNPVDTEVDLRFSPAAGRYVQIQLQTNVIWGKNHWPGYALASQPPAPTNLTWNVGEVELFGFAGPITKENAVVLPNGAADPLVLAASELSYYLGELTGKPHPVIAPSATNQYSGTMYRIVDLKPLAPDYSTMTNNIANGTLPNNVHVVQVGREVQFSAWPYRCVLWSVWEFLERQGVRWVYPEGKGDYVPTGAGVDLSFLPLTYTPSATSIYPGFNAHVLAGQGLPFRPAYLYIWRNHWTASYHGGWMFLEQEIPYMAGSGITLDTNYTEGFLGHAGNFLTVVPRWKLNENTNWWGYDPALGYRVFPIWPAPQMCIDNPDLIAWVAAKMVAYNTSIPIHSYGGISTPLATEHFLQYLIEPYDVNTFCKCPQFCAHSNTLDVANANVVPWVKTLTNCFSGSYFSFVDAVARQVAAVDPSIPVGALAYDSYLPPPAGIAHLATNLYVEVVLYGNPGLPISSIRNTDFKKLLTSWATKCSHLSVWSYALLQEHDYPLPVPLVTATVDQAKYLAGMGALNGLCQADVAGLPYNPWNFYVWPRIRWNTNQTADTLLQEFFDGYFREVSAPMLAYYKTLENSLITNDVSLHTVGLGYHVAPGAFPLSVLYSMQTNLITAEASATNWVVKDRVAKIREGFNYVITNQFLVGTNLNDWSPYAVVPASGTYSVVLTNMVAPTTYGANVTFLQVNGHWQWIGPGVAEIPLHFTQGGTYRVVVTAKGTPYKSIPTLNVYLGPRWQSVALSSTKYVDYTCSLAVPAAGVWNLDLTSDTVGDRGYTRLIDVSQIQITRQ